MQARPWKRLAVTFLHWPWSTKAPMQTTNAGLSTENRACFKCTWELENQTSNSDVQSCHLSQRFHFFLYLLMILCTIDNERFQFFTIFTLTGIILFFKNVFVFLQIGEPLPIFTSEKLRLLGLGLCDLQITAFCYLFTNTSAQLFCYWSCNMGYDMKLDSF